MGSHQIVFLLPSYVPAHKFNKCSLTQQRGLRAETSAENQVPGSFSAIRLSCRDTHNKTSCSAATYFSQTIFGNRAPYEELMLTQLLDYPSLIQPCDVLHASSLDKLWLLFIE